VRGCIYCNIEEKDFEKFDKKALYSTTDIYYQLHSLQNEILLTRATDVFLINMIYKYSITVILDTNKNISKISSSFLSDDVIKKITKYNY
jgi:hypothetical protein